MQYRQNMIYQQQIDFHWEADTQMSYRKIPASLWSEAVNTEDIITTT
jgi:hypothetical protein